VLEELLVTGVMVEAAVLVEELLLMAALMAGAAVQAQHQKAGLLAALAQLDLFGPAQQGNFHQLIQGICNDNPNL
jgi:hypothetical protein